MLKVQRTSKGYLSKLGKAKALTFWNSVLFSSLGKILLKWQFQVLAICNLLKCTKLRILLLFCLFVCLKNYTIASLLMFERLEKIMCFRVTDWITGYQTKEKGRGGQEWKQERERGTTTYSCLVISCCYAHFENICKILCLALVEAILRFFFLHPSTHRPSCICFSFYYIALM